MKYFYYLLILLVSVSCVSTKYNVYQNHGNFDKIQAGTRYTVYDKSNRKFFVDVTSVKKDSIIGTRKQQPIALAKNDIKEIKKNKTGATVALVGGGVVLVAATWALVDFARNIGGTIGITNSEKP
ncbi:hypothetical protein Q73A0000_11335 [Kaistella flava (ex Peng et al. 2021)]|uniref:Uncharacterized protein n=1 Tax=Kaistella flava (ex Peng et al. 2021) TaxID=2038776 RepID=A0A7M2YAQ1_9FLAO|nr:hypothetical protein [Kaistella flava (ex Peng et al. 2021)]QOW10909.1 hypothetical protein Q73A0000_11335 [Kaistella flava (ex Peng et al. 2021)]